MKAVIKRPGSGPDLIDVDNDLEALQQIVGGYIETLGFGNDVVIFNEEGMLLSLPKNCIVNGFKLVGTVLIVGADGEDFTDVHNPDHWLEELDLKVNQWV